MNLIDLLHFPRPSWQASATPPIHPLNPRIDQELDDDGVAVLESKSLEVLPPPLYQVWMLNDDFTPMEFVVYALQEFFSKDHETSVQIMLKIHLEGRGVCGVYSRDVAATKVSLVMDAAKQAGHPLQCVSEPMEA